MKKTVRRILFSFLGVLTILLALSLVFVFKMRQETSKMHPIESAEILSGVFAIKNQFVNAFLIKCDDGFIAIDAGINKRLLIEELLKFNIQPEQVKAVLLTHSDGDHTGGIEIFRNAEVYLSRKEVQMVDGTTPKFLFMKNHLKKPYKVLPEEQQFEIGGIGIKAIEAPGHTPGSVYYQVKDSLLFTGDGFSIIDGRIDQFNDFFNMDTKAQLKTIQKIPEIEGIRYILTAHYGYAGNYSEIIQSIRKN